MDYPGKETVLAILRGEPETVTRRLPVMMLPAIVACILSAQLGGFGILTCAHLFAFSVLAASMSEYKTERGLWMLSVLFAVFLASLIGLWTYALFIDLRRGVPFRLSIAIDGIVTMFLMRLAVRFLWQTSVINYSLEKEKIL